ncbi:chorismate synthase [Bacteriovoracaceae bacterium]|nr:chorismate synthase [Bacteriovoracaceae bacterium]
MRGNTFGKLFSLHSFGESHGPEMGVVIDGVPSNLDVSIDDLQKELDKRRPGKNPENTERNEADMPRIISGVFENKTLGSPICVLIKNNNHRSQDYEAQKNIHRPGHADETTLLKYGIRDYRGGGRASARETVSRVIAGYFASLVLPRSIKVRALISQLGNQFQMDNNENNFFLIPENRLQLMQPQREQKISDYLLQLKKEHNSVGGTIKACVENCPVGLGEPAFDKLKADLAKAMLSINAVVGFEFGQGINFNQMTGKDSIQNRQNFGGIEGGISNGQRIDLKVTFKPVSTVNEYAKSGRHDPCVLPRATVIVESMIKIVLADHFLRQSAYSEYK